MHFYKFKGLGVREPGGVGAGVVALICGVEKKLSGILPLLAFGPDLKSELSCMLAGFRRGAGNSRCNCFANCMLISASNELSIFVRIWVRDGILPIPEQGKQGGMNLDINQGLTAIGFMHEARTEFSSAPISKRFNIFTLETLDTICVAIKGFINGQSTFENGIPSEFYKSATKCYEQDFLQNLE
ncbi:hypothetical protein D8674_010980 [Pyrus ussuriensis x Pyrus communis]|uniref:SANTA domain-containing protein n=1 Tax=Pyrus ussuriensis x Pyrus communis TaxID=2448454 RepID=A0A5N5G330_9ROSA|nr:hypothetical protein D8674_010980 [Pyrus ussuriensis x Pyrus communis]